jgi:hypothetical protein
LLVVDLASQPLQLPSRFLGFVGELSLTSASTASCTALLGRGTSLALGLLLLPPRELLQLLQRFF